MNQPLTMQEALTANEFHAGTCSRTVGPRGGITIQQEVWRRNGSTKTWKRRPTDYAIPVKHGMRTYNTITQDDTNVHTAANCPLNTERQ